jgi:hypothetical protein
MGMIFKLVGAFCVATILAQGIILGGLVVKGRLTGDSLRKIAALACGIDISVENIREAIASKQSEELPSFEEILERRAIKSLELEQRHEAVSLWVEQLKYLEARLAAAEENFDRRREADRIKLEELSKGVESKSNLELQQTFDGLKPELVRDVFMKMLDNGELSKVIAILQGMPQDRKKKVLGTFTSADEKERVFMILQGIGDGEPEKSIIDQSLKNNQGGSRKEGRDLSGQP